MGAGLAAIPERLLIAHARGEVLFVAGAGISRPSNLPDFRGLVLQVYEELDAATYAVLRTIPSSVCNQWGVQTSALTHQQAAEVKRFVSGDYDVVLGMLERRIDGQGHGGSSVRRVIGAKLRKLGAKPSPLHKALVRLADRGGTTTIVTTNFDLLLEDAAKRISVKLPSYALGGMPRPGRRNDFAGVLHIHGALERAEGRASDLIVSDQDFGEFYLRRRVVPDFIYDAARLFNIVLVGYSANDPPMRYLLNAVAADGTRFDDLKERFTMIGTHSPDPAGMEDWKSRGITPIPYDAASSHSALLATLIRWADISAVNGKQALIDSEIKRIVKKNRTDAAEADRDLFDHLVRRANANERIRLSRLASQSGADLSWLSTITSLSAEMDRERRR
jgi:hypothetical protein